MYSDQLSPARRLLTNLPSSRSAFNSPSQLAADSENLPDYICRQLMSLPIITDLKICDRGHASKKQIATMMQHKQLMQLQGVPKLRSEDERKCRYFYRNDDARKYYTRVNQVILQVQTEKLTFEEMIFILQALRLELPGTASPTIDLFIESMRALDALIAYVQKISTDSSSDPVSGLLIISDPGVRTFFQGVERGLHTEPKELATIIYQWSRQSAFIVNGKKWECKMIRCAVARYIGNDKMSSTSSLSAVAAQTIFDTCIWPFFAGLKIGKQNSIYLANAMVFEGFLANIVTELHFLFILQYKKLAREEVINNQILKFDNESALINVSAISSDVLLTLHINMSLKNLIDESQILVSLEFEICLYWTTPESTVPRIRSFTINSDAQKANLPGTPILMKDFLTAVFPNELQMSQFLEYHRRSYSRYSAIPSAI